MAQRIEWEDIKAGDIISTKKYPELAVLSISINDFGVSMETQIGHVGTLSLNAVSKIGEFDIEATKANMENVAKMQAEMDQPIEQAEVIGDISTPAFTEAIEATNALIAELRQNSQWAADRRAIVHMLSMAAAHRDVSVTGEKPHRFGSGPIMSASITELLKPELPAAIQALAAGDIDKAVRLAAETKHEYQYVNLGVGFVRDWATWMLHGVIFAVTGKPAEVDNQGVTIIPDDPRIAERAQEIIRLAANMIDEIDVKELAAVEIAERFGVEVGTVRQAINRGTLKARKSGRDHLVKLAEAERYFGRKQS